MWKTLKRLIVFVILVIGFFATCSFYFTEVFPIAANVRQAVHISVTEHESTYSTIDQIPLLFQKAVIDTEDRRFYQHFGIDLLGIARSIFVDLSARKPIEGGSTITQQLVRDTLLSQTKTLSRKAKEIVFAVALEQNMEKREILELYLNDVYFGHGAYGAAQAANVYFGKPLTSLSLPEWSLLAGLPNAPKIMIHINHLHSRSQDKRKSSITWSKPAISHKQKQTRRTGPPSI
ncbi:hypothetical protein DNHGIG_24920 [Collibacillus ludicampi]|uniref:peptidoglycan glycosyltransferase n=1 Tax=Collibacillus ludicampi TaxID=2771369 RepID=A0AAV4LGQ5_9BACL|nr:biosynthetic peptidoglycan transglycosylase [Collibacillus ludicampi]GIM46943.1 hypothetical protein DNHGIG_24920 [Collibacillus ludicampi]